MNVSSLVPICRGICTKHRLLITKWHGVTQTASFMKLKVPEKEEDIELPSPNLRWRLSVFEKVPQTQPGLGVQRMTKELDRMRGPELVHNKLIYGKFGIQALGGGRLKWTHTNMIRLVVNRFLTENKSFATWRISQPWQPVTKKGAGKRMSDPKGSIDHYVYPVKAERIIFEIGGNIDYDQIKRKLKYLAMKMPFEARVVTKELLEQEEIDEKLAEERNINPFSYERCIKNNYNGVTIYTGPYDQLYLGKYR